MNGQDKEHILASKYRAVDFEKPIEEINAKIEELRLVEDGSELDLAEEIKKLQSSSEQLTKDIFNKLNAWQISKLARHPLRPYTLDYLKLMCSDFIELHGDRHFADDAAIVTGLGKIDDIKVVIIGHQKGRTTKANLARNFGMPRPEGYRKAQRIMLLAERFNLPIVTFIDTPGAYPGIDAEERGQSEAIASNLCVMSGLKVPIISIVTGEGGSGGALAIGLSNRVFMLEYSIYSVISPEGCASILWKKQEAAQEAANAMNITAKQLFELKVIDGVIDEPLGGAHRNLKEMATNLKAKIVQELKVLMQMDKNALVSHRKDKFASIGRFTNNK